METRKSCEAGRSLVVPIAAIAVMAVMMNVAWQEIDYQLQPEREAELTRRREAVIRANLYLLRSCIDQHLADKGYHPESLQTLVDERYLKYVPVDPFSGTAEGAWEELDAKSSEIEELKGGCRSSKQVTDVRYADDTRVSFDGTQIHEW